MLGFSFIRRIRRRRRRPAGTAQYRAHRERARALVHARLAYWQGMHPFTFGMVRIKNNRSSWGSCSGKRNLNFNWRLVLLPPELADYVLLHELCHTVHLNHSADFWALLNTLMPNFNTHRKSLRAYALGMG